MIRYLPKIDCPFSRREYLIALGGRVVAVKKLIPLIPVYLVKEAFLPNERLAK